MQISEMDCVLGLGPQPDCCEAESASYPERLKKEYIGVPAAWSPFESEFYRATLNSNCSSLSGLETLMYPVQSYNIAA